MFIQRIALRLAAVGALTAAGALSIGADQLGSLAEHLESMVQTDAHNERADADEEADAAARADDEGYPLGRADADGDPSGR